MKMLSVADVVQMKSVSRIVSSSNVEGASINSTLWVSAPQRFLSADPDTLSYQMGVDTYTASLFLVVRSGCGVVIISAVKQGFTYS